MTDQTHSPTNLVETDVTDPETSAAIGTDIGSPSDPEPTARPENIPEKFWDPEAGSLRTEALLKSYLELERRLGAGDATSPDSDVEAADQAEPLASPDIPEDPDGYEIETTTELVNSDPEINRRLHEAGFTRDQAQLVYQLAEEYLLPAVSDAYGEVMVQQELGRLEQTFGGPENWQTTADQLRTWGKANLDGNVYETLASSHDGVLAMHAMMQAREPAVVHADEAGAPADEGALRRMMQDPRYWRDRDPAFIAEVTRGFERLFKE